MEPGQPARNNWFVFFLHCFHWHSIRLSWLNSHLHIPSSCGSCFIMRQLQRALLMTLAFLVFLPKKAIGTRCLLPLHHRTTTDSTQVLIFHLNIAWTSLLFRSYTYEICFLLIEPKSRCSMIFHATIRGSFCLNHPSGMHPIMLPNWGWSALPSVHRCSSDVRKHPWWPSPWRILILGCHCKAQTPETKMTGSAWALNKRFCLRMGYMHPNSNKWQFLYTG